MIANFMCQHRFAGKKLLVTFLLSLCIVFIRPLYILSAGFGLLWCLLCCIGIDWRQVKKITLCVAMPAALVLAVHGLSGTLMRGGVVALQMVDVFLVSYLLVSTTRELDLICALEKFLYPFRKIGINPQKISFLLFLSLRSITIIRQQYQQIRLAQKAKGLDRHLLASLMPLLIKFFRTADAITDALIAKGFEDNRG